MSGFEVSRPGDRDASRPIHVDGAWMLRAQALAGLLRRSSGWFRFVRHHPQTEDVIEEIRISLASNGDTGHLTFPERDVPAIGLQATFLPRGGRRWWFVDPDTGRLAARLYWPAGTDRFRTRSALARLSYPSQRQSPRRRAEARAIRIRLALGGSADLHAKFPPKPVGMHCTTYERRRAKAEAASIIALAGQPLANLHQEPIQ